MLGLRLCMLPDELLLELPEPIYDCAVVRVLLSLLLRSPLPNEGRDPLFVLFPIVVAIDDGSHHVSVAVGENVGLMCINGAIIDLHRSAVL